jgi:thiopurine S-methyltransferase
MDAEFWQRRWEANEIGFHEGRPNVQLVKHAAALGPKGGRVFVPLCGKTHDMPWLLSQGYRVAGVEWSRLAVDQFFAERGVEPVVVDAGAIVHYAAPGLDVFHGDLFALTPETLGPVDAIYDRAALVALPQDTRTRYAAALVGLTACAPQLVVTFEYDQSRSDGPPFSVTPAEVERLYAEHYDIEYVESGPVDQGIRGVPAVESTWRLRPRSV